MSDAPDVCDTAVVKMTLGYDEEEDRIYLDCLTPSQTQIRLWVTQRLMQRLVRHLECSTVSHTLGNSRQDVSTGIAASNHEDPVPAGLHGQSFLVSSVDVSTRDSDILLVWRGVSEDQSAAFSLPINSRGDWLRGVMLCFEKARWPVDGVEFEPSSTELKNIVTVH